MKSMDKLRRVVSVSRHSKKPRSVRGGYGTGDPQACDAMARIKNRNSKTREFFSIGRTPLAEKRLLIRIIKARASQ